MKYGHPGYQQTDRMTTPTCKLEQLLLLPVILVSAQLISFRVSFLAARNVTSIICWQDINQEGKLEAPHI